MKNAIRVMVIVSFFLLLSRFSIVTAADRFAECDACGYCRNRPAPENWNDCAVCLYAQSGVTDATQASENKTLLIDQNPASPNANKPPSPASGKYFTQLGCIDTGLASFRDPSAAGGVLNFLLMNLIFPTVGTLAFGTIIYGGFLLATAQGEHMKILQGRRLVLSAIVGLVFTFSSILIINTVGNDILRIPGMRAGTKVTFVGYGTPTNEGGKNVYPNLDVYYDTQKMGSIELSLGSAAPYPEYDLYLSKKLDLTNVVELKKVKFVFTNDMCYAAHEDTARQSMCCYFADATNRTPANPNPRCNNPNPYSGDRNVFNYGLKIDGKDCLARKLSNGITPDPTNGLLQNNWGGVSYSCDALVP